MRESAKEINFLTSHGSIAMAPPRRRALHSYIIKWTCVKNALPNKNDPSKERLFAIWGM